MSMNGLNVSQLPQDPLEQQSTAAVMAAHTALQVAAGGIMSTLSEMPADLSTPIKEFIWSASQAADLGVRSMQVALGLPRDTIVADPTTREMRRGRSYPQADPTLTANTLNQAAEKISQLEHDGQNTQGLAAALVGAVYRASAVPDLPQFGASEARQAELRQDMTAILEQSDDHPTRQFEAIQLIKQAVAANDMEALHVLMGPRMALIRQRLGLDDTALAIQVFKARKEKILAELAASPDANTRDLLKSPKGWLRVNKTKLPKFADFLDLQWDGTTSLGNVATQAAARLRHQHTYTRSHGRFR